jgi:hypothetical protein
MAHIVAGRKRVGSTGYAFTISTEDDALSGLFAFKTDIVHTRGVETTVDTGEYDRWWRWRDWHIRCR